MYVLNSVTTKTDDVFLDLLWLKRQSLHCVFFELYLNVTNIDKTVIKEQAPHLDKLA